MTDDHTHSPEPESSSLAGYAAIKYTAIVIIVLAILAFIAWYIIPDCLEPYVPGSSRRATSAGVPSCFDEEPVAFGHDLFDIRGEMTFKDRELAGVAPYSLVLGLRDPYGSVALL
jgi:hypothetical protein